MYETYATVVGTLITQINKRRLDDGTSVVSFRVASNERRYDRTADDWVDGDTLYVSVTCWRKLAENVHASFVTGDPIVVHGRVYTRSYEKDGQRHSVTEMEAAAVGPDLTRCTAAVTRTRRANAAGATTPAASAPQQDAATGPAIASREGGMADGRMREQEAVVEVGVGA